MSQKKPTVNQPPAAEPEKVEDEVTQDTVEEQEAPVKEKSHTEVLRETYPFMAEWSDAQVNSWYQVMQDQPTPYVNDGPVLVFDPDRARRPASDWTTEELEAYLRDQLKAVKDTRRVELVREFRKRVPVVEAWSDTEVFDFYRHNSTPAKTSNGVWVNDITRGDKSLDSWSNDEVEAWILGELKTNVNEAKMIAQVNERFDMTLATNLPRNQVRAAFDKRLADVKAIESQATQGSLTPMNENYISGVLKRYYELTKPGQVIDEQTGGRAQRELDNVFNYVFNLEGPALLEGLKRILEFVRQHRDDIFSPTYAHRFTHLLKGDKVIQRRHINTIELFVAVTNPVKAHRKQLDVKALLKDHPQNRQDVLYDYFTNYAK